MKTIVPQTGKRRSSVLAYSVQVETAGCFALIGVDATDGYIRIEPVRGEDPNRIAKKFNGVVLTDHLWLGNALSRAETLLGMFGADLDEIPTPTGGFRFVIPVSQEVTL